MNCHPCFCFENTCIDAILHDLASDWLISWDMLQKLDGFNTCECREFGAFCNANYAFCIIFQILVGNRPILVLNFIIPVSNTCIVL